MKTENLISIEDQNSKIDELFKDQLGVEIDNADKHVIRLFAKWYAEKVIDKCADSAKFYRSDVDERFDGIDEESILNVKNML